MELEACLGFFKTLYFEDIADSLRGCSKYNILTKSRAMEGFRKAGLI